MTNPSLLAEQPLHRFGAPAVVGLLEQKTGGRATSQSSCSDTAEKSAAPE